MTRSLAIAALLLSVMLANAQQSAPAASASSIAGTVVKEPGSEPLKKVLVQVVAEDQKQGGNYSATTDADGHFRIENIAPGRYRLFLEKTGLVEVNGRGIKADANIFTVQAGHAVEDLLFRMLPTAIISGRVTDEDGDPMSGVRIVAQKKKPGKATREPAGSEATNDLGEYRLAGLFPGQYWIVAMPPPDMRDYEKEREKSPQGDNQNDAQPDTRYVTTYYPGTYRCHAGLGGNAEGGRRNASEPHVDAGENVSGPRHCYRRSSRPEAQRGVGLQGGRFCPLQ